MKNFSLLYCDKPLKGGISDISFPMQDIIQHCISGDSKRKFVTDIISQFDNNVGNIIYRQELVQDFINNEGLLNDLTSVMVKIDECKLWYSKSIIEYREARKYMFRSVITFREILKETINLLLKLMETYALIGNKLDGYHHRSSALRMMEDHIGRILKNDSFNKIKDLMIESISNVDRIIVSINNDLNITNIDFIIPKQESKTKKVTIPINSKTLDEYNYLYNSAASDSIDIILNISDYLLDYFRECSEELWFYEFAMKYHKLLKRLNIPYCFPSISSAMAFKDLYELNLLISKDNSDDNIEIKFNSFNIDDSSGVVIVGPNNSGKTVFIRSLAAAQILGQAGLFIPAVEATISIKKHMNILYASAETNEGGGRFEQEVRAMSEVVDQLEVNDIIIMNEYFQSTMEREGINVLYDIFSFLAKKNIFWIAVTNFQSIIDKQNIFNKETNKSFKVLMTNFNYEIKEL